jgi:hypothetical protein
MGYRKVVKIIHPSLGVDEEEYKDELRNVCQRAYDNGTVIVASARAERRVYLAVFDTVIESSTANAAGIHSHITPRLS